MFDSTLDSHVSSWLVIETVLVAHLQRVQPELSIPRPLFTLSLNTLHVQLISSSRCSETDVHCGGSAIQKSDYKKKQPSFTTCEVLKPLQDIKFVWFLTSSASPLRTIIDEDLDVMREFIYIRNIMCDLLILALAFLVTCGGGPGGAVY